MQSDEHYQGIALNISHRLTRAMVYTVLAAATQLPNAGAVPVDPGVRRGSGEQGPQPLPALRADELNFFRDGLARFTTIEVVNSGNTKTGNGLGPRFNADQCSSCHSQPTIGGSSPATNPLIGVANADGANNTIPWFVAPNGPVREARFVNSNGAYDGGVHDLFVISARPDAGSCKIAQPDFGVPGDPITGQGGNPNVVFRIPTPLFGAGLIESISDSVIRANMSAHLAEKREAGIAGHPNLSSNDGTIARFGWKAQNKSLLLFAGEAYNVEMGISNQLFPQERDESPGCQGGYSTPNDTDNFSSSPATPSPVSVLSDIEAFANFMRLLAPPTPAPATPSTTKGRELFTTLGCSLCHSPTFDTGASIASGSATLPSVAMTGKDAELFSDLLVHHMGQGLADGITQGAAGPDEFRTAPLWGLGQRVFFLHDGRTGDLFAAIRAHASAGSEANVVIQHFDGLPAADQQDLLDFLRSL
jgi:CxxC motif-containing protein (DUF1111 family)